MTESQTLAPPPAGRAGRTKIRVAYVIDTLFFPAGGTEGQLLQLLHGIDRERFEPELYCLRGNDWLSDDFDLSPVTVLDLHLSKNVDSLRKIWGFSRHLRHRYDLVQTHFRDGNIVGVMAAALAGDIKVLSTRRGVPYWSSGLGLTLLRNLNGRCTHFLANCHTTARDCAREERIAPERFDVIYNGLEASRFDRPSDESTAALRASLDLPPSAMVVGIVANLRRVKGIDVFLRAAARVLESEPDTQFMVVGQGDEENSLRTLVDEMSLGERVHFLGARSDVPALLQVFDIGVLASHSESFSNSILEYLVSGLPVVVTDVGGAAEVVREAENGYLVPAGNDAAMAERLMTLLRVEGGPRAWRGGETLDDRFEVGRMVRAYEDLYARLVHGS
jgi:glycosyltransferase involved in cell wall biosynthesis